MKWPEELILVRHDVSAYNVLKGKKVQDPEYRQFLKEYEADPESNIARELAIALTKRWRLGTGDHDTHLVDKESQNAEKVGRALRELHEVPHVVFASPYERAQDTFAGLVRGWPELADVKRYDDERIREQEHGLSLLYNDWKLFCAIYPEQRRLREIEGNYWYRFPQGENVPDVRLRNRLFTDTIIRDFATKRVLAVTHHLNILAIRANFERWGAEQFLAADRKEKPINCGVTVYEGKPDLGTNGRLILKYYNKKYY